MKKTGGCYASGLAAPKSLKGIIRPYLGGLLVALSLHAIAFCCCNMSKSSSESLDLVARRKQSDQVCWAEAPNRTCFSISRTKLRHRADPMSVIVRYCPFPSVNGEKISCTEKINFQ